MKKLISNCLIGRLMLLLLALSFGSSMAMADAYEGPAIRMFYPGESDPPQTLKANAKAYTYFVTPCKVYANKARIVQNGQVLGTCVYRAASGASTTTMNPALEENADLEKLQGGLFTLEVYEVTYEVNGEQVTYSDENAPIGSITYNHPATNGTILSQTGLEDGKVLSYFPLDGEAGVKSFTFSKPLAPADLKVFFEYGRGDNMFITNLPYTLSDDLTKLTIDLRGTCYNPDVLAPGAQFFDVDGSQLPPPSVINMNLEGLKCADGTMISTTITTPAGGTYTFDGKAYYTYDYVDLTFPTPVLEKAEFYASANPADHYLNINAATDMMALTVTNADVIASADVMFTAGSEVATVLSADVVKGDNLFTVALPAAIRAAGSDNLVISLANVVFEKEDGTVHTIQPLDLANVAKERTTIAEVKACPAGSSVVLLATDVKVTMATADGYTFIEDANDGLWVVTEDYSKVLDQATALNGRIAGTYIGEGQFMIDVAASDYTTTPADVYAGIEVANLTELSTGAYDYRLVTLNSGNGISITYDEDQDVVIAIDDNANSVIGITQLIADFEAPETIDNVTGVFFADPSSMTPMLLIRSMDDFNHAMLTEVNTIAELKKLADDTAVKLNVDGAKVTFVVEYGPAFLEDQTGAILVDSLDGDTNLAMGMSVFGSLCGTYTSGGIYVDFNESEIATSDVDVTFGTQIDIEDAANPDHLYRLVTFVSSPTLSIVADPENFGALIGNNVACVDWFDVLPYDYEFPQTIDSVTGIIMPSFNALDEENSDATPTLLTIRSADDIVASTSSIIDSLTTTESAGGDVYDLRGVKVRNGGESLQGLAPGIYVCKGRKVVVK